MTPYATIHGDASINADEGSEALTQKFRYEKGLVTLPERIQQKLVKIFRERSRDIPSICSQYSAGLRTESNVANRKYSSYFLPSRMTVDLIACVTVDTVFVPQSMPSAKIATLPVQCGLYSSFVGLFIYCFFDTSKDVTIGPVVVMSLRFVHHKQIVSSGTEKSMCGARTPLAGIFAGAVVILACPL